MFRGGTTTTTATTTSSSSTATIVERTSSPWRMCHFYREHEIGILLFCIGVWNNAPYVIMLASAKDVSEGGVALVYIANILPGEGFK